MFLEARARRFFVLEYFEHKRIGLLRRCLFAALDRAAIDAEAARGFGDVAAAVFEDAPDVIPLDAREAGRLGRIDRGFFLVVRDAAGEVLHAKPYGHNRIFWRDHSINWRCPLLCRH